ncbi:endonuclease 8-like 3 [Melospiza melodia melodia]|uniref:endonuclease 8-like 3 n=1 Tax=Melospiza melodia melodia TaxID=1914991 RepID=UPI002FD50EA9
MVEGPGCALCAERLRARLRRGQRVRAARGGGGAVRGHGQGGAAVRAQGHGQGQGHGHGEGGEWRCRPGRRDRRGRCPGQRGPALLLVAVRGGKCHRVCMRASERAGAAGVPALAGGAPGGMISQRLLTVAKALASAEDYTVQESLYYGDCKGLPDTKETAASKENISGHDFLVGHVYRGVETLGKELFMYFDQKALRIHFGMNGSMRINPDGSKERNEAQPVLEIQLMEDTVCFWDVTVEYRNAAECEQKVRMMESLDVCSPKFSFSRAEQEIKQQKTRMLCDVLLDQSVLPGVGNIIKNEALFDSGLHPALKVCQLTDEHIRHLVKMTRDFTLLFYKCRRAGSPLYQHYRVYKRAACRACGGSITVCRLGEHGRVTYFCSQCQKADPQLVSLSKLPARSSLIGWAYGRGSCSNEHVARKSEEEWTCMCCTLINKPSAEICDACLTPRPEVPKMESSEDSAAFNTNLMKYPCNDFRKPSTEIKINRKTAFGTTTLVLTDLGNATVLRNDIQVSGGHSQCVFPKSNCKQIQSNACQSEGSPDKDCSPNVAALALSSCQQPVSFKHIQKKQKTDHVPLVHPYNTAISAPQTNVTDATRMWSVGHPRCSKHNRLCSLRVVRKDGENKGRQFYCCPLSRETRCEYFQWADLDFPFCNHGKRCVMKTVLKIGPNNGKNFFVCPLGKEKQCGFFQWAKNGPGMQILP